MIPESFFTWEALGTCAGATVAVMHIVEFTKELPGIRAIPTRLWAYIIATVVLILSTVFTVKVDAPHHRPVPVQRRHRGHGGSWWV